MTRESRMGGAFAALVLFPAMLACGAGEAASGGKEEEQADPARSGDQRVEIVAREFRFEPAEITVERGETTTLVLENQGALAHNLTIEAFGVRTDTIQSGERTEVTVRPEKTGAYRFVCKVPGHAQAGMQGTIRVVP